VFGFEFRRFYIIYTSDARSNKYQIPILIFILQIVFKKRIKYNTDILYIQTWGSVYQALQKLGIKTARIFILIPKKFRVKQKNLDARKEGFRWRKVT